MEKKKKSPVKKSVVKKTKPVAKGSPAKNSAAKHSVKTASAPPKIKGLAKPAVKAQPAPVAKIVSVKTESTKVVTDKKEELETSENPIRRASKLFFIEVKPGAERVIKRGDKSLVTQNPVDIQTRRKDSAAEETPEELVERIERELQHQSFFKRSTLKPQMCTKCGFNVVSPRFTLDRELGYCDGCAEILRLGNTKEARRMEINTANATAKKDGDGGAAPKGAEPEEDIALAVEGDEEPIPDIE